MSSVADFQSIRKEAFDDVANQGLDEALTPVVIGNHR
jgi:hypothetical protein